MIHKHNDCRTISIPTSMLGEYRRVIDYATTELERAYGIVNGKPNPGLTDDQAHDLKLLDNLRMAIHEDY